MRAKIKSQSHKYVTSVLLFLYNTQENWYIKAKFNMLNIQDKQWKL